MKQLIIAIIAGLAICLLACCAPAQAKPTLPPNATAVVKCSDGNYYALYKGKVAALTKIKKHAKVITVPKSIKANGKKYKVVTIHDLNLTARKDVKKVIIKCDNMETVEEPMLFKSWRKSHHKKLIVQIKDKETRLWLNAAW